ncbi:MAG: nuclear transport factor 2 family protein [Ferruginibacter sp.]
MKPVFLLLLITTAISCNQNPPADTRQKAFDLEQVKSHITEMNKTYGDRFLTDDTAFYQKRYCKDAQAMPEKMPALVGREAIQHYYYDNGKNRDFKVEIIAGNIYGNEELVLEEGTYNFPDGKGASFDNGKFIAVWKQENGIWKLYREIWNSNVSSKQ